MNHELRIDEVGNMGRCIFSSRPITKGDVIMKCEILVLPEFDTLLVNDTVLKHYVFKYDDRQDCIVLGHGSMFNHAPTVALNEPDAIYGTLANVSFELVQYGERKLMFFLATRDIEQGEQLFIDYTQDTSVDVNQYLKQVSLIK